MDREGVQMASLDEIHLQFNVDDTVYNSLGTVLFMTLTTMTWQNCVNGGESSVRECPAVEHSGGEKLGGHCVVVKAAASRRKL